MFMFWSHAWSVRRLHSAPILCEGTRPIALAIYVVSSLKGRD
jgi:hypothetical protein